MTAEGKARVAPAPSGGGIGRCCPPSVPCRGHLPLKGGEGCKWRCPHFCRSGRVAARPRLDRRPVLGAPVRSYRRHSTATLPAGRHPRRSAAQSGGPFVPRAIATGAGRWRAGPVRKRRRPRPPLMTKSSAPAATGGVDNTRRGCQWIPGQAGDDGRELGKERAAHLARAGQPSSVTTGQRTRCQSLDRRR